jgi:dUTP pyrophosphatase
MLKVLRLDPSAILPRKAHPTDAGYDIACPSALALPPKEVTMVHTGIACEFPAGHWGLLRDRSSIAKHGVFVVAGVLDEGYRGEIVVAMYNSNDRWSHYLPEHRVAQLILLPTVSHGVEEVDRVSDTPRGSGGFGSTGQ